MVSPGNMHKNNSKQTEQVVFRRVHVSMCVSVCVSVYVSMLVSVHACHTFTCMHAIIINEKRIHESVEGAGRGREGRDWVTIS